MDDEHDRSAHDAPGPEEQPLPGSVSEQNGEEQPSPAGGGETRRKASDRDDGEQPSGGESSEGSQSTGDPRSAG